MQSTGSEGGNGFVYAATGPLYTTLARRSARNLRQVMPMARIDLFTDQDLDDPVFDRTHRLTHDWFRPRMEAIRRARFDRMVVLDADTIVLRDVSDLFSAVDTVLLAATLATGRPPEIYTKSQKDIPRSFPYLNAGVMVARNGPDLHRLCEDWEAMIRAGDLPKDQPALRRLLHQHRIPFQVLPPEYNIIYLRQLDIWEPFMGAPCILHIRDLHQGPPGDPTQPFDLATILSERHHSRVQRLLKAAAPPRHAAPADPGQPRADSA